jgi:hypothetical protein
MNGAVAKPLLNGAIDPMRHGPPLLASQQASRQSGLMPTKITFVHAVSFEPTVLTRSRPQAPTVRDAEGD